MDQHGSLALARGDAPLLLAVESATQASSVALLRGVEVLVERCSPSGGQHAERLLPMIERVLCEAEVCESQVEVFAVSIGPGSFTGLRVGLATVKGLAFGTSRSAVPVSTLAALAWGYAKRNASPVEAPIAALLDARRGEVYAAVFQIDSSGLRALDATQLLSPQALVDRLPERCIVMGEGAALHASALRRLAGPGIEIPDDANVPPRARSVGELAVAALDRGEAQDPASLVPHYVRRAEAEVARTSVRVEDAR